MSSQKIKVKQLKELLRQIIIDVINADFVQHDVVCQKIVSAIKKPYSLGVHQLSLQ